MGNGYERDVGCGMNGAREPLSIRESEIKRYSNNFRAIVYDH